MSRERTLILTDRQIGQKITRMAHEIHERNYSEKELVVVGIAGRGHELAERLEKLLRETASFKVSRYEVTLNKDKPLSEPVTFSGNLKDLRGKSVVLVDDVLNSGRTLIYAAQFLLNAEPKTLATATLVDRFHRRFPVRADYVGLTLSTNLKEHVTVEMGNGKDAVYLE